jgi:hypothetical protein
MPGQVRPVTDERDALLAYLEQQRYLLRLTAYGLRDDQIVLAPSASELSVGGLVKHVASVERYWINTVVLEQPSEDDPDDYGANFRVEPGETLADLFAFQESVAKNTASVIASIADLGQPVKVPRDAPWFPQDIDAWSVRWVLLHLISETARHAGHADIVRESIDGGTGFPLMAAAEGWPGTPWLQPWQPAS